jgi:proteasome lid subunit RPN8/RPN11
VNFVNEVIVSAALENDLTTVASQRLPYETCGIIYGSEDNGTVTADGFELVRNVSPTPDIAFAFHPADWIEAYFRAQKNQRVIVGLFHSHPLGSAVPSLSDSQGYIPWCTYWIVSLSHGDHGIAVYRLNSHNHWDQLPIKREP